MPNLFDNTEYLEAQFADSQAESAVGDAALARGAEAAKNSDGYIAVTLLTATALFFAGVTTSFGTRPARIALLAISLAILAYVAMRMANLPVA